MTIELVPGTTNVVRLPSGGRTAPTLDLLREIAPDVREVSLIADAYGVAMPSDDLRQRVDAETAEYILNQVDPQPGPARTAALRELLRPLLVVAVRACRDARMAAAISAEARRRLARAKADGGYWITPLTERAADLSRHAAELLVAAYILTEEAEGAARAVGLAESGQSWMPFDLCAESEALFVGDKHSART
ncbi:MAG TPA: hypothetical protein VMG58_18160 [Candidatus Sulfotelmatobacter sp.]|nr:hypothetical protein [Candidatus Sulfotelmatobacter sp.]